MSIDDLPKDRTSRIILAVFGAVILALILFLIWAGRFADEQEARLARIVLTRDVGDSVHEIRACLLAGRYGGLSLSKIWKGTTTDEEGLQGYNHLTDIGVRIRDLGNYRRVQITTARARPLRQAERAVIDLCLGHK